MFIKDIARITAGYNFRGAIKPDNNGNIFVIQAKDFVLGEKIADVKTLTKISCDIPEYSYFLKKNDILTVARGMKSSIFRSAIFMSEESNVIASSSVLIIRVDAKDVLPEYVLRYLNSKDGQKSLAEIVSGSHIGVLPRNKLEEVKIPIPSFQQQKTIVDLYQNIKEQQKILEQKNNINQNIINGIFKNLTK